MESRHVCVSSNEMSSVSFGVLSFSSNEMFRNSNFSRRRCWFVMIKETSFAFSFLLLVCNASVCRING